MDLDIVTKGTSLSILCNLYIVLFTHRYQGNESKMFSKGSPIFSWDLMFFSTYVSKSSYYRLIIVNVMCLPTHKARTLKEVSDPEHQLFRGQPYFQQKIQHCSKSTKIKI